MTHEETRGSPENAFMHGRLRLAGVLILGGLVVQGLSLLWNHPLSFFAFLGIGGLLTGAGMVIYLAALISPRGSGAPSKAQSAGSSRAQ